MPTRLVLQGTKVTSWQCLGLDKGVAWRSRVTWAKWGSREAPGLLLRLSGHWMGQDWCGVSVGGLGSPGTGENWVRQEKARTGHWRESGRRRGQQRGWQMAGGKGQGPGGAVASAGEIEGRGEPVRTPNGRPGGDTSRKHCQGGGGDSTGCRKGQAA